MAYEPYEWHDGEEGETPIVAERLNALEDGVADAHDIAEGKADATHNHAASAITSGTLAVARIPDLAQSKITGLAAALSDLSDALDALAGRVTALEGTGD